MNKSKLLQLDPKFCRNVRDSEEHEKCLVGTVFYFSKDTIKAKYGFKHPSIAFSVNRIFPGESKTTRTYMDQRALFNEAAEN